jgi:prephenate dehydrogenase
MNKIAIIGAGRVGESTAQFLATSDISREVDNRRRRYHHRHSRHPP